MRETKILQRVPKLAVRESELKRQFEAFRAYVMGGYRNIAPVIKQVLGSGQLGMSGADPLLESAPDCVKCNKYESG